MIKISVTNVCENVYEWRGVRWRHSVSPLSPDVKCSFLFCNALWRTVHRPPVGVTSATIGTRSLSGLPPGERSWMLAPTRWRNYRQQAGVSAPPSTNRDAIHLSLAFVFLAGEWSHADLLLSCSMSLCQKKNVTVKISSYYPVCGIRNKNYQLVFIWDESPVKVKYDHKSPLFLSYKILNTERNLNLLQTWLPMTIRSAYLREDKHKYFLKAVYATRHHNNKIIINNSEKVGGKADVMPFDKKAPIADGSVPWSTALGQRMISFCFMFYSFYF